MPCQWSAYVDLVAVRSAMHPLQVEISKEDLAKLIAQTEGDLRCSASLLVPCAPDAAAQHARARSAAKLDVWLLAASALLIICHAALGPCKRKRWRRSHVSAPIPPVNWSRTGHPAGAAVLTVSMLRCGLRHTERPRAQLPAAAMAMVKVTMMRPGKQQTKKAMKAAGQEHRWKPSRQWYVP